MTNKDYHTLITNAADTRMLIYVLDSVINSERSEHTHNTTLDSIALLWNSTSKDLLLTSLDSYVKSTTHK